MARSESAQSQRPSMAPRAYDKSLFVSSNAILLYIALSDFIVHMSLAGNYGYFRDELYYIVAGQHLSFGYVDFPPIIAVLASIMYVVASDSLVAIHILPALAGSAIVFVAGKIAQELGGGKRAQILAALATLFSASFAVASIFSMDVLDMLWWTLLAYILVKIVKKEGRSPRLWLLFGLVAGLGLLTKLTITFFLLALGVSLAVTSNRSYLKSKWLWLGALIAILFVAPYVVWNWANGFPTVDFYIHHGGLNGSGPLSFLVYQILIAGPAGIFLAILGIVFYFRKNLGRTFGILALSYLILLVIFTLMNAKPYFIMGAYPFLFAGGGALVEKAARVRRGYRWISNGYVAVILIVGIVLSPLYAPILPPQTFVNSYSSLTGTANGAAAQQTSGQFPQYLGDRFGWDTMTQTVAQIYDNLPAQERSQTCVLTFNYGEASALAFLGKRLGLPPVISGHNNFYLWGPGNCSGSVLIVVGYGAADILPFYNNVTVAGYITCTYCMNSENNLPVLVATNPKASLQGSWSSVKHFS
jgi:4-amino-4-deoxy-L-arabinose transferase-like glycosyltransferase